MVEGGRVEVRRGRVVREMVHDEDAFTQGIFWHDGGFYESTGLRGRSSLRRLGVDAQVERVVEMAPSEFGEGCGVYRGEIIQVVWKEGRGLRYSTGGMARLGEFRFEGDGWGVAVDGDQVFMSDGSDVVRVMEGVEEGGILVGLREVRRFTVVVDAHVTGGKSVGLLNELQVIRGELWANIWMSELVARIDMATGVVNSWVDLRGLLEPGDVPEGHEVDVLNGIAWDSVNDRIFVTGKLWPRLFEIQVSEEVTGRSLKHLNPFFTDPVKCKRIMSSTIGA